MTQEQNARQPDEVRENKQPDQTANSRVLASGEGNTAVGSSGVFASESPISGLINSGSNNTINFYQSAPSDPPADALPDPDQPPYIGLTYYDYKKVDIRRFFGREVLSAELAERIEAIVQDDQKANFFAIIGASGSGKSSLVRAGILPQLMADGRTQLHLITPDAKPLKELATSLTWDVESVTATTTLMDDMHKDPRSLHLYVCKRLAQVNLNRTATRLLLVVDQFEELFTLCDDVVERDAFINNLTSAVTAAMRGDILLLITMRADFYHRCAPYEDLRHLLEHQQKYIGQMAKDDLRAAIEKPADAIGYQLEAGLVDQILLDVGNEPGNLPLLSHALQETWKNRKGARLTLAGYRHVGGVAGAIAKTADKTLAKLNAPQKAIARTIFLRLTESGEGMQDTRRRAALLDLVPQNQPKAVVLDVVKRLADARLLTTDAGVAEVAHEALIREWGTLRAWLDEDREGEYIRRRLSQAAMRWMEIEEDASALYRGLLLKQAQVWTLNNPGVLNAKEQHFLTESVAAMVAEEQAQEEVRQRELAQAQALITAEQQRVRLTRWALAVLSILLAVAVAVSFIAVRERNRMVQERNRAESQNRISLAQSLAALGSVLEQRGQTNRDLAILLAIEAVRIDREEGGSITWLADSMLRARLQTHFPNQEFVGTQQGVKGLIGSEDGVNSVAWSSDDRWLATGSGDSFYKGIIRIWDTLNWGFDPIILTGHEHRVWSVTWSSNDRWLASASDDHTVRIWDAHNWMAAPIILTEHGNSVYSVSWSNNNRWLASASGDDTIRIWDTDNWTGTPQVLTGHESSVYSVSWSSDDRWLASASDDGTVRIWDAHDWVAEPRVLIRQEDEFWSVSWSSDDRWLVSTSFDGTLHIWDVHNWSAEPHVFAEHEDWIRSVSWSNDNHWLASASSDGTVRIWNTHNWAAKPRVLMKQEGEIWSVSWSNNDHWLVSTSFDGNIHIWESPHGVAEPRVLMGHENAVSSVSWSKDNRWLASASSDHTIRIWDVHNWTAEPTILAGHEDVVNSIAWSHNDRWLASASRDNTVRIWDAHNWAAEPTILTGHGRGVNSIAWSHNGRWLASADGATVSTIRIWDAHDWAADPTNLTKHWGGIHSIAWSHNDRWLASADGITAATIRIWDTHDWATEPRVLMGHKYGIYTVSWSHNDRWLASADYNGTIYIWDPHNWMTAPRTPRAPTGHGGAVYSVSWSHDSRWLASASGDNTIRIWNAHNWAANPTILTGHEDTINSVAWSNNDRWLASASDDGTIRIWASLEQLVEMGCRTVIRNLTWEEWQLYLPNNPYKLYLPYEPYNQTCRNLPIHPSVPLGARP